jgi:hypothetical protein
MTVCQTEHADRALFPYPQAVLKLFGSEQFVPLFSLSTVLTCAHNLGDSRQVVIYRVCVIFLP